MENPHDLVKRLLERARIRRQIPNRKSVLLGEPDRLSELLEEAVAEIDKLLGELAHQYTITLEQLK